MTIPAEDDEWCGHSVVDVFGTCQTCGADMDEEWDDDDDEED